MAQPPSLSQVDPDVLAALPLSIRQELSLHYSHSFSGAPPQSRKAKRKNNKTKQRQAGLVTLTQLKRRKTDKNVPPVVYELEDFSPSPGPPVAPEAPEISQPIEDFSEFCSALSDFVSRFSFSGSICSPVSYFSVFLVDQVLAGNFLAVEAALRALRAGIFNKQEEKREWENLFDQLLGEINKALELHYEGGHCRLRSFH